MPRYFFDTEDGEAVRDMKGVELPHDEAARRAATVFAGELLRDRPDEVWGDSVWKLTVQNEDGLTLFVILVDGVTSAAAAGSRRAG